MTDPSHERTGKLATARLRWEGDVVLDLLLASSGIEAEIVQRATLVPLGPGFDVPVAQAEDLLASKVPSASPERPQDAQDFVNLVRYNPDFDDAAVRRNLALIESRGCARGQDLIAKYEAMLAGPP